MSRSTLAAALRAFGAACLAALILAPTAAVASETSGEAAEALQKGNQLQRERRYTEAAEAYAEGLAAAPDHAELHHQQGIALRKAGDAEGAVAAGSTAVRHDPSYVNGFVELGRAYTLWIQDRAVALHQQAVAGGGIDARIEHGVFLTTIQRHEQAIEVLEQAQALEPDHTLVLRELASLYVRTQRYDDCIRVGERALELRTGSKETVLHLGEAYMRRGKFDQAIELLRRTVHENHKFVDAHLLLAKVYERSGKLKEAGASLRRTLTFLPDRHETRYSLAGIARRLGADAVAEREMRLYELLKFKAEIPPEIEIGMLEEQLARNPLEVRVPLRRLAVLHGELGHAHEKDLYGDRVKVWEIKEEMDFAIAGFRAIAELHPSDRLRTELEQIGEFRREYERASNLALEYELDLAAELAATARKAFDTGDRDVAIRDARRALSNDPGSIEAHHLLAEIYSADRIDLSHALRLAGRALDMDPSRASYDLMTEVYRRRGNHIKADKLSAAATALVR
ncbi:hypothetical protein ABI59_19520 [Acidobacteria bacterium Mor1]|nr:hypothetical protein ABI59_19520 [Acidobacteria bacterium Mor1]